MTQLVSVRIGEVCGSNFV